MRGAAATGFVSGHQSASRSVEPRKPSSLEDWRAQITAESHAQLASFLSSPSRLVLPRADHARVSIVIVLFNRAELTFRCLRSIAATADGMAIEVILVDNASSDETLALAARIDGATTVRFEENRGYLAGCNVGARSARGTHVLLLNSDTELVPGTLAAAVDALEGNDRVGAVGARLILPDGSLQEAGSIIWRDGSCLGYGRGEDPEGAPYAFTRDVDFCSAAFLLTRRSLFEQLGGFDTVYAPAYYEDADYCARVWQAGYRVRYDPRVTVRHYEFGSSRSNEHAITQQLARRSLFVARHHGWLRGRREFAPAAALDARVHGSDRRRILVFDDRVPHTALGSGFPRAVELVRTLVALQWEVTFYPLWIVDEPWEEVYSELPRSVEVMTGLGPAGAKTFLRERAGLYRVVLVSRSHNIDRLRAALGPPESWCPDTPIVYDAEAVQASREAMRRRIGGTGVAQHDLEDAIGMELRNITAFDAVITVSALERECLARTGRPVHLITHQVRPQPGCRSFKDRSGFLFVGAFGEQSPNADSILWFCANVLPRLRALLGPVGVTIAGHAPPPEVIALGDQGVRVLPDVADLSPIYNAARVVIAPTRFAAGIPLKVIHAAAAGVPVVCTHLLAQQLTWRHGIELLAADDAADFTHECASLHEDTKQWQAIRRAALDRVAKDHSPEAFTAAVAQCLEQTLVAGPRAAGNRPERQ
jgi:GT2 family glycosyltransferase